MFKPKKQVITSKLTISIILAILMLPERMSNYECKKKDQFQDEESQLVNNLVSLKQSLEEKRTRAHYEQYILETSKFGDLMIDPDDNTKMIKMQSFRHENQVRIEGEIDVALKMSNTDIEMNGQFRVAPRLDYALCVATSSNNMFVPVSSERFRGNLNQAIRDKRFITSMSTMSHRFEFYRKLMKAFSGMVKASVKHCTLNPLKVLYKEEEANFNADYDAGTEVLTYFPVITGYDFSSKLNEKCKGRVDAFTDPDEYSNKTSHLTSNFKGIIEMFSMCLVILSVEAGILTNQAGVYVDQFGELENMLDELSEAPETFQTMTGLVKPLSDKTFYQNFEFIGALVAFWNTKKANFEIDFSIFTQVFEYVMSGAKIYQKFVLEQSGMEEQNIIEILKVYDSFVNNLLMMVRKNEIMTSTQRPNVATVVNNFDSCRQNAEAIENGRRRRALVMI